MTEEFNPLAELSDNDLIDFLCGPVPLVRGGTYFSCRLKRTTTTLVPKFDKNGRKTRYKEAVTTETDCHHRVKIGNGTSSGSKFLRHMRKVHHA